MTDPRRLHGLYRTPASLIGYVVRSVHVLLREKLGLSGGLADPAVRLLDPAAGAMNFFRAAWRTALEAGGVQGRFTAVELLPEIHARGLAVMRRFQPAERLATVLGDALTPPPEILDRSFNVVLGNPPWRGHSNHGGPWIKDLIRDYFQIDGQPLGERNSKWLHDDYVKFLRLAQWLIDRNGEGIVAFVLNHNCLDAPTFRGLRCSLLRSFQEIYALDLHGNRRRGESGSVFPGVAQGAAVLLLVKKPGLRQRVLRADLDGSRAEKLRFLVRADVTATPWAEAPVHEPGYFFVRGDRALERELARGVPLPEIFPVHGTGIVTGRDADVTALDRATLLARFGAAHGEKITPFLARPFDLRFILYEEGFVARPRRALMSHMLCGGNVGLVVNRQCKGEPGALVTRWPVGHKVLCPHDVSSLFPLYLETRAGRRANLAPGLTQRLGSWYGVEPAPETVLGYVYAVLSSAAYRKRYRELLRLSFPRILFPRSPRLFAPAATLGRELIGLHLLEDERLDGAPGAAIEPAVWEARIGAYAVLPRWLRARGGGSLPEGEARELRRIGEALRLGLKVQSAIEEVLCD